MAEDGRRLDHVGLAVAGLEAAAAWFCDVFGLVPELSLRVDAINLSIEMLIHPEFGYRLELLHRPGPGSGDTSGAAGSRPRPPRRRGAKDTGTWRSTSPTSTAPTTAPLPAGRDRSCRRARHRNPGCGWRSSPTPRATSSNFCTGQGGTSEPNPAEGYTGGSCTLIRPGRRLHVRLAVDDRLHDRDALPGTGRLGRGRRRPGRALGAAGRKQHLNEGQTGGSCTLTTAERPPCTMASASFRTWGSSAGSETVTP